MNCFDQVVVLHVALMLIPDSFRGPRPENRSRSSDPLTAGIWQWHLPVHFHREKLQTHLGEAAACGPLQSYGQQRVGGDRQPGPPSTSVQRLDSERWSVQGPANHPQPTRDGTDQPVLPGLLAVWRGQPWGQQSPKPEGVERTEEASQPPASWRADNSGWNMSVLHVKPVIFKHHPCLPFHTTSRTLQPSI